MSDLILEIKEMIISGLNLEDMSVSDIDENAPLFGEGLGLDSVDALELDVKEIFANVVNLADFISKNRK